MGKAMSILANCTVFGILLGADIATSMITWASRSLVRLVDCIGSSGENTVFRRRPCHAQRFANAPVLVDDNKEYGELDVDATMKQSKFPLSPEVLIKKAKVILAGGFGTKPGADDSCLADDFQFVAPIIGPLGKAEYLLAVRNTKLWEALPDLKDNCWFKVDPLEPNRLWFFSRATGTHLGKFNFGAGVAATGKAVRMPPQAQSMLFNEQGQVYTLTAGYCMDRRIGNTEGLGGFFGILNAVGKPLPFPEGQRGYTPSLRFEAFERVNKVLEAIGVVPTAAQKPKTV